MGWKCVIKDEEVWWSEQNRLLISGLSLQKVDTNLHPVTTPWGKKYRLGTIYTPYSVGSYVGGWFSRSNTQQKHSQYPNLFQITWKMWPLRRGSVSHTCLRIKNLLGSLATPSQLLGSLQKLNILKVSTAWQCVTGWSACCMPVWIYSPESKKQLWL